MDERRLRPPVRAMRLSDQIADQLQELVVERSLRPGDKIPSERELCELLGVSRTVVREAIRSLVVKGLLEVRPGGGTAVRQPDTALVSELMGVMLRIGNDKIAFSHVHEVRRLLEVEIAALAAERHDEHDLQHIEERLRIMRRSANAPKEWAEADVAFHAALAEATHNPLYLMLLGTLSDLLLEVRLTGIELAGTRERALYYHTMITECVRTHDSAGARAAMFKHLEESEETFQRASRIKERGE